MASATPTNGKSNGKHVPAREMRGATAEGAGTVEYLIIVHPAGRADAENAARFWTEVPALAACTSDGDTVEQAVRRVQSEIARWLQFASRERQSVSAPLDFDVAIQLAF